MTDCNLEVRGLGAAYGRHVVLKDRFSTPAFWRMVRVDGSKRLREKYPVGLHCRKARPLLRAIFELLATLSSRTPANAKRELGYACAPENLPPLLTARQCFEVHAGAKGLPTVDADLMSLAEELKFLPSMESFVDTLSLGTRQKLAVLLSLIGDPKLIVFDEAFNGLDPCQLIGTKGAICVGSSRIEAQR